MEKIWISQYPKGVPAEIDVNEYASVREIFEEAISKHGTRPAFTCMGKSITFSELDVLSMAFGAWLQGQGLQKGARVALMMPNVLQYPVCLFGVLRAGRIEHEAPDVGDEAGMLGRGNEFSGQLEAVVARLPAQQRLLGARRGDDDAG